MKNQQNEEKYRPETITYDHMEKAMWHDITKGI